jgi:hypothetical protein
MNKLDTQTQNTSFPIGTPSHADASTLRHAQGDASLSTSLESARRLIVLVPSDSDYNAVTRRVWELAIATGTRVQLLGLCKDAAEEPGLRRVLVTMAALVQDPRVSAEANVEVATNWLNAVKRNYQVGDIVVCFAEQRMGVWRRPLSEILESHLSAPIYILAGFYPPEDSASNWVSQIAAWIGSLSIIAGSFLLQARITFMPKDWAQTTLLILSVIGEVWLIWVWNSQFN